jgi:hypothetical protein
VIYNVVPWINPSDVNKSGAVTAAAIIALIGSLLILLLPLFGFLSIGSMQTLPQNPDLAPADARRAAFVGFAFIALVGIGGLVSSVGLFRYRNWARISTLIWSALTVAFGSLALFFISTLKIPVPPNSPDGAEAAARVLITIISCPSLLESGG